MTFYREILQRERCNSFMPQSNTNPKRRSDDDSDSGDENDDSDHSGPPSPQLPPPPPSPPPPPPPPPPPSTITVISSVSPTRISTVLPDSLLSLGSTTLSTSTITRSTSQNGQPPPPSTATIFVTTTQAVSVTTNSSEQTLPPQPSNISPSKAGHRSEMKAVQAVLATAVIILFLAICYILFRFCPPVHSRWLGFIVHRAERKHKGMGVGDLRPTEAMGAATNAGRPEGPEGPEGPGGVTAGARLSVPPATTRSPGAGTDPEGGAGPRPPSYRTAFTASGASWVADGFRLPERFSQRVRRSRLWFGQSDGPSPSSRASESVRASTWSARLSSMSSGSRTVTEHQCFEETVHREMPGYRWEAESQQSVSEMHSHHSMCGSQLSEVSRMSSRWIEQDSSSSLAPLPLLTLPGLVAGDNGVGLTGPERMRQEPD